MILVLSMKSNGNLCKSVDVHFFVCITFLFLVYAPVCMAQNTFTLQECVAYALSHRHEVMIGELQMQEACADLKMVRNMRLPSVQSQVSNGLTSGYEQEYGENGKIDYLRANNYVNEMKLELSLPLWTEDTNGNLVKAYKFKVEAAMAESDYQKLQVKLDVIDRYYTLALTQIRHKMAIEQKALQDSTYKVAQNLFKIGRKDRKDVIDAQFDLEQDEHNVQVESDNVAIALHDLLKSMNYVGPLCIDTSFHFFENLLFENTAEHIAKRHPYVAMESLILDASEKERLSIQRRRYPSFFLNAGVGTYATNSIEKNNSSLDDQWKHNSYGRVGMDIKIPIFRHLDTKLKLYKNTIKINQCKENIARTIDDVRREIEKIVLEIKSEHESIGRLETMLTLAKEEYQMAMVDYRLGNMASYELNVYKTKYMSAILLLSQAKCRLEYKSAILNIYSE